MRYVCAFVNRQIKKFKELKKSQTINTKLCEILHQILKIFYKTKNAPLNGRIF